MKKITLALAVSSVLGVSSTAHALTASEFANGVLVPHVLFNDATSTAVGLTSCSRGRVFWTFFDVDTKHIIDGDFVMTPNDWVGFQWSSTIGTFADAAGTASQEFDGNDPALFDQLGYLVFVLDDNGFNAVADGGLGVLDVSDTPCLAGNAFQIFLGDQDVAYIPALPLNAAAGDFGPVNAFGVYEADLTDMNERSVKSLQAGARAWQGDHIYLNYVDDAGATTDIVIWSAQDVAGTYTVDIFNLEQQRASTNLTLPNAELNVVNVARDIITPNNFDAGFILWDLDDVPVSENGPNCSFYGYSNPNYEARCADGIASFSLVLADAFGARQTVLNPIRLAPFASQLPNGLPQGDFRTRFFIVGEDRISF